MSSSLGDLWDGEEQGRVKEKWYTAVAGKRLYRLWSEKGLVAKVVATP